MLRLNINKALGATMQNLYLKNRARLPRMIRVCALRREAAIGMCMYVYTYRYIHVCIGCYLRLGCTMRTLLTFFELYRLYMLMFYACLCTVCSCTFAN